MRRMRAAAVVAASSLILAGCGSEHSAEDSQVLEGDFWSVEIPATWGETDISWVPAPREWSVDMFRQFYGGDLHEVADAYGDAEDPAEASWQVAVYEHPTSARSVTGDLQNFLGAETTTEPNQLYSPDERPEWLQLPEDPDFRNYHMLAFLLQDCPMAEVCEGAVIGVGSEPALVVAMFAAELDEETFSSIHESIEVDGLDFDQIRGRD